MAEILIKMGVNAPSNQVKGVLATLEYIYEKTPENTDVPMRFQAFEKDFTDSAIGVLASMSIILRYEGADSTEKEYIAHVMQSFRRTIIDGESAFDVIIPAGARNLLRIVYEQRKREDNDEERSRYVQQQAEEMGFT
ncbi:MAG: hypothetical protein E7317_01635 [Clostridiales bacterium]|nr:hypothetical protein [Clostridiales bacterium]